MPSDRFYVKSPLLQDENVRIEGTEFHHLVHVMRAGLGDQIEIVNGSGALAYGAIELIEKKSVTIKIDKVSHHPAPAFKVILAQAIPRSNRLDWILEKGTELGMTEIWLFPGAHSERKVLTHHQIERMEAITIAAMKQSGRLDLPLIKMLPELKKWDPLPFPAFFGDLSLSAPPFEILWKEVSPQQGAFFFVGPESGFNDKEHGLLKLLGAHGVKLHQNILRTDTAPLAALALIHHWLLCGQNSYS